MKWYNLFKVNIELNQNWYWKTIISQGIDIALVAFSNYLVIMGHIPPPSPSFPIKVPLVRKRKHHNI